MNQKESHSRFGAAIPQAARSRGSHPGGETIAFENARLAAIETCPPLDPVLYGRMATPEFTGQRGPS